MMTLEEVWENLRQDPEIKATMEEVDRSYKLFKKIENLIIADLEYKLEVSEKLKDDAMYNFALLNQDLSDTKEKLSIERRAYNILHGNYSTLTSAYDQLKQQLAKKDEEVQSWKDGTMVVKLGKLEEQLAEKEKEETKRMEDFEKRCQEYYKGDEIKYDFAIETLEKLRHDIWTNQSDDGYTDMQVDLYDLNDMIDVAKMMLLDEIEELKGEK